MAMKKEGAEMPAMLLSMAVWSIQLFLVQCSDNSEKNSDDTGKNHCSKSKYKGSRKCIRQYTAYFFFRLVTPAQVREFDGELRVATDKDPGYFFFVQFQFQCKC